MGNKDFGIQNSIIEFFFLKIIIIIMRLDGIYGKVFCM